MDRITKLVFIRFNSEAEALDIPSDNMFVDGEPIFTMENGRKKRIGLFTQKINGYGAFFTTENGLYEGTAIYDIEGHFAGILMGRLNDKLYLFLYADMLAFYKDNIDSIREMKRPKLGIMVTEMWEFPGIRIKESANKSLKKNDIIIKVDSFLINNVLDFNRALFYSSTKKKLRFTVLRGKEKKMITVYGG